MNDYKIPIKWVTEGYAVVEAPSLKVASDVVQRDFPAVAHCATDKSLLEVHRDLSEIISQENQ